MRIQRMFQVAAVVGLLAAGVLAAQDRPEMQTRPKSPANTITVQAKLVVVPAVVRNNKGALINNLTKNDFALTVGGKPQTVRYFDHDVDVPLTLGLLVDTSRSMQNYLDDERKASQSFLQNMLAPAAAGRAADKAFVVQFAHQIELLQDVTDSTPMLAAALKQLGTESPTFHNSDSGGGTDSEGRQVRGGGTTLYDAIFLSSDEVMSKQTGRKALIVLTDGVDSGSKETLPTAIEAAQRADTVVYAIYYKSQERHDWDNGPRHGGRGGGWPGGGGGGYPGGGYPGGGYPGGGYPSGGGGGNNPNGGGNNPNGGGGGGNRKPSVDGKQVMARICGETGGRVFEVSKKDTVEAIYAQIGEELRAQYRLGFTPDELASQEGYHQITLTVTGEEGKKKPFVQTRDGYYTGAAR